MENRSGCLFIQGLKSIFFIVLSFLGAYFGVVHSYQFAVLPWHIITPIIGVFFLLTLIWFFKNIRRKRLAVSLGQVDPRLYIHCFYRRKFAFVASWLFISGSLFFLLGTLIYLQLIPNMWLLVLIAESILFFVILQTVLYWFFLSWLKIGISKQGCYVDGHGFIPWGEVKNMRIKYSTNDGLMMGTCYLEMTCLPLLEDAVKVPKIKITPSFAAVSLHKLLRLLKKYSGMK